MRTTVDIPDELYQQVELKAAQVGISVGHLITRVLRLALGLTPPAGRQRVAFPLHHSAQPGTLGVEETRAAEETTASPPSA